MKTPTESDADVVRKINQSFHTNLISTDFLPVGESSQVHVGETLDGQKLVIKAQEAPNLHADAAISLLESAAFKWMPQIIKSEGGQIWEKIDGLYYSVQQYIGSVALRDVNSIPNETYLRTLGTLLKDLHSVPFDPRRLPDIPIERFDSPLVELAYSALENVTVYPNPNEAVLAVQKCYQAQHDSLARLFANLRHYGQNLAQLPSEFVLTHGDVHFGNILDTSDTQLYLVDWDEASLALPEMDLKYFSDDQLAAISQGYGRNLLENQDRIQYYRNLQMIRALWFWSTKLLNTTGSEQEAVSKKIVEIFDSSPFMQRALGV